MTEVERLRALLAEARRVVGDEVCIDCGVGSQMLWGEIDAALAETSWQPHEDPSRTAYVVQVERERGEAVAAFHEATRLRSGIQQARIKAENERDEARAEVAAAFRRGAEAMREKAAHTAERFQNHLPLHIAPSIRALPVPEGEP